MRKNRLLLPILLLVLPFTSCGESGSSISSLSEELDYYIVDFNYNYESNDKIYISSVVNKDGVLNAPEEPNIEDVVFEGWYLEKECENEYLRFGLAIDSNFTLYAKWTKYETLDDLEKISRFQDKMFNLGKDATSVTIEKTATIGYPGIIQGEDGVFGAHEENRYNRYNDITTLDYYTYNEDGSKTLFGKEQFYYTTGTNAKFYDIYVDLEDATQNSTNSSTYKKDKVNSFLSIDYINIYGSIERNIANIIENGNYSSEDFIYEFNLNYTKVNGIDNYTYTEGYYTADYSDQAGAYVENQYTVEYGVIFENGKVKACNVHTEYYMAIGGDIYYYTIENAVGNFYYSGAFTDFTGERLTPNA